MENKELDEFVIWYMQNHGYEKSAEKLSKQSSKKLVYFSYFLENSGNFLNFTKSSNKFREF